MSAEMKFPHYTTKQAGLHHRRLRTKGWDAAREMVEKAHDVLAAKGAVLHRHVPVVIERERSNDREVVLTQVGGRPGFLIGFGARCCVLSSVPNSGSYQPTSPP